MPGTILDVADFLEAEASKAQERGEHESAVVMLKGALRLRVADDPGEAKRVLRGGKHFPKIGEMDAEHKAAISEGRSKGNRMMRAARKAGYATLGDLCKAVNAAGYELKAPFLSKVGTGLKPTPPDLAKILKRLIAWEP